MLALLAAELGVMTYRRGRPIAADATGSAPTKVAASPVGSIVGPFVALPGPFVLLMALGAMLPTIDFDALEYHIQGPQGILPGREGSPSWTHNVYTSMPFGVEMLHLLGMDGGWATGGAAPWPANCW